jgi:hypothetical protein
MASSNKGSRPTNTGARVTPNTTSGGNATSRPLASNAAKAGATPPKSATISRPLPPRDPVARRAPIVNTSTTRQARLAMQEQKRRTQNTITGVFVAILVVVAALIVWNVVPKPTPAKPKPVTYGLLSDFSNGGKTNIKPQEAPVTLAGGLQYADVKVGTGQAVKSTDTITANYTGWLTDGTKFDSSLDRGQPSQFSLNQVIKGWTQGLVGMKIGGERRLLIPGDLAYGANPPQGSNIPPNATLIFDVSLVSIP